MVEMIIMLLRRCWWSASGPCLTKETCAPPSRAVTRCRTRQQQATFAQYNGAVAVRSRPNGPRHGRLRRAAAGLAAAAGFSSPSRGREMRDCISRAVWDGIFMVVQTRVLRSCQGRAGDRDQAGLACMWEADARHFAPGLVGTSCEPSRNPSMHSY